MAHMKTIEPESPCTSDVAKYLLEKKGSLTGYQLQKLLYYCQAWSLVVNDKPLFPDEVRTYKHGPTIPSVSMQHQYKYTVRPRDISGDSNLLSESDKAFIDEVLAAYDGMSGQQLEALTHSEEPWISCFNQHTGLSSAVVSHESMQVYYARLLASTDEEQLSHHVPSFSHPKNLYVTSSDYD